MWTNPEDYLPKESDVIFSKATQKIMDDNVTAMNKLANTHGLEIKPKRFVDLLSEGVTYIECGGFIHTIYKGTICWFSDRIGTWNKEEDLTGLLFQPATPTQNPERKKKVVYKVLYISSTGNYRVSSYRYDSKEAWDKDYPNSAFIRLIEESREEIEG